MAQAKVLSNRDGTSQACQGHYQHAKGIIVKVIFVKVNIVNKHDSRIVKVIFVKVSQGSSR